MKIYDFFIFVLVCWLVKSMEVHVDTQKQVQENKNPYVKNGNQYDRSPEEKEIMEKKEKR